MADRVHDALNEVTDALEDLRVAVDQEDEDIPETFAMFEEAVKALKSALGLSPPRHGTETA